MPRPDATASGSSTDGVSRRDFLRVGALTPPGLALPALAAAPLQPRTDVNAIMLVLVGGPSQIDTWDPKPDAPDDVRGPFRPIATNVPGIQLTELFPLTARHADKYSLIRSVHHDGPAVHGVGLQLMQTGRFSETVPYPHIGCVLDYHRGHRDGRTGHVLLPRPIGDTGGGLPHGQTSGRLGAAFEPTRSDVASQHRALDAEPSRLRERYGDTPFGRNCLFARHLIERGTRFVTVNMFQTVFDEITWDVHGARPFTDLDEMAQRVAPDFDRAYSALLEDLSDRGLLATTIVTAAGEFGRTPRINPLGGRDHHPGVWTIMMGGGPIQGGRVIGSSDAWGAEPKTRPVTPGEIAATLYRGLGVDPHGSIPGMVSLVDDGVRSIEELF